MDNKSLYKIISISAILTGAILGLIPLFPVFTGLAFILVIMFSAPFIILYLYKLTLIEDITINKCILIGAISGFFAFIGFSFVYLPIARILYAIFKIDSFIWIKVIFSNFGFLIGMIIFTSLLSSMMNMFSAFITFQVYKYIKNRG